MRYLLILTFIAVVWPAQAQETVLFYDEPAAQWEHALPVGNGRLGAMVFGNPAAERIQFNEETLWSGGPYDPVQEGAHAALPEIQRLLFAGEYAKAHDLFGRTMMGIPYEQMKYQPFGDLYLHLPGHENATDYRRELDLDTGIARTSYTVDGVTYTRDVYASEPDQVIVVHLTASQPGSITFSSNMHGIRNTAHSNYGTGYFQMDAIEPNQLRLTGRSSTYLGIEGKMRYEARVDARTEGGQVRADYRTLYVEGADSATLVIAAATNHVNYKDVSANPAGRVAAVLEAVKDRSEAAIRADHLEEHQQWFRRVKVDFMGEPTLKDVPTDERIARLKEGGADPSLAALYYQFGRYLLIASSRPGTQPANLQGIWQDRANPSWDSKYTININLPMNYWLADSGNLSEMNQPLWMFTQEVAEAGARTAREHWNAGGWVLHQNTDLWRSTTPMDGPSWGAWPVGGAWVMTNLYDHYRYTQDREFLEDMYPVLKGQVEFLLDILVEHPEKGWLVTAPSNSPENFPAWEGNGRFFDEVTGIFLKARTIAIAPTMDMHIIREVFAEYQEAAALLGVDAELAAEAGAASARLVPNQIGKNGQLQEWIEDFDEIEPEHRHLSHLWGVYPGSEITPEKDPVMAQAARVSVQRRGTGGCGWSYGWRLGLWARLYNPDGLLYEFKHHLTESSAPSLFSRCFGTLQVDGTFGAAAAISEAIIQSHQGFIDLLPALPAEWGTGHVDGLRARGDVTVDLAWSDGKLTSATLQPGSNGMIRVRAAGLSGVQVDGAEVDSSMGDDGILQFEASAGTVYQLTF